MRCYEPPRARGRHSPRRSTEHLKKEAPRRALDLETELTSRVGVKRLAVGQCSSLLKVPHVRLTTEPSLPRRELQISKDPRDVLSGAAHGCKRDNRKLLPRRLLPAGCGCKFASPTLTNVLSGHAGARSPTGAGTTSGLGAYETQGTDQGPARHAILGLERATLALLEADLQWLAQHPDRTMRLRRMAPVELQQ